MKIRAAGGPGARAQRDAAATAALGRGRGGQARRGGRARVELLRLPAACRGAQTLLPECYAEVSCAVITHLLHSCQARQAMTYRSSPGLCLRFLISYACWPEHCGHFFHGRMAPAAGTMPAAGCCAASDGTDMEELTHASNNHDTCTADAFHPAARAVWNTLACETQVSGLHTSTARLVPETPVPQ